MKQTLSFLHKFCWQFVGVFAFFALLLMWGTWFTRAQESGNLFYTYFALFPLFFVLMPAAFGMSMRYYLELCISFGAVRKSVFWALQLLCHLLFVAMLLIGLGMELFAALFLPAEKMWNVYSLLDPATLPISCLLSLAFVQGGICLGRVKQTKLMGIIMGVTFGLFGAYIGVSTGAVMGTQYAFIDPTKAWYWWLCGGLCAAIIGLFILARRLYQKAAVSI